MCIFSNKIESFEIVTLHESGMRYTCEYEIVKKDGKAEISLYGIKYSREEDRRALEKRVLCDEKTVLDVLNKCGVLSWDGFNGPHPKNVLDGKMFNLKAAVNGDKQIYATGSQNFPRHYRDLTDWLYEILHKEDETKQ